MSECVMLVILGICLMLAAFTTDNPWTMVGCLLLGLVLTGTGLIMVIYISKLKREMMEEADRDPLQRAEDDKKRCDGCPNRQECKNVMPQEPTDCGCWGCDGINCPNCHGWDGFSHNGTRL